MINCVLTLSILVFKTVSLLLKSRKARFPQDLIYHISRNDTLIPMSLVHLKNIYQSFSV